MPSNETSWSMIPQGTPVAICSACWHASARSRAGSPKPATWQSARAEATSRAALEERPEEAPLEIGPGRRARQREGGIEVQGKSRFRDGAAVERIE